MIDEAQQISWTIAARDHNNFFCARPQAKLLLQGSRAVRDPSVKQHIAQLFSTDLQTLGLMSSTALPEFKQSMTTWLLAHPNSSIKGLDNFNPSFSAGTTQSFDSFYFRHREKRMRCFVGEYFYHLKTWISNNKRWSFITESDPLVAGDALVISVPFCDDGNLIPNLNQLLKHCNTLNIPVLIDCCYFPISSDVNIDLNYSCIDTVAFSLSKAFPVANLRIGIRYTRKDINDGQTLHDSINYNNSLSAYIGMSIINKFSANYIHDTYKDRQRIICERFGLTPSQSVLFAIGNDSWNMYNRSNLLKTYQLSFDPVQFKNRICLVGIYDNWDIFNEVTS